MENEITYEHISLDVCYVLLGARRIGMIRPCDGGYQFFPEGAVYAFEPARDIEDLKYNLRYDRGQARIQRSKE